VELEWDEEKRREILARRGVDLLYAALIFEGEVLTRLDVVEGGAFTVVHTSGRVSPG
jgi:uncharacterized DUF497 family protein